MSWTHGPARVAAAAGAVALLLAACTGDDGDAAGEGPSPTSGPPTSVVDYSNVALGPVRGETTTTTGLPSGSAVITGTVAGPEGLVPGATIHVERMAGGGTTATEVSTDAEGRFELSGVPGGRYRVRAYLAPALAMASPEVRFLRDGEEHTFDLTIEDQRGLVARGAVAPDPPLLGEDVNLAVVVASREVDTDGVIRSTPVVGVRVELDGLGAWVPRPEPLPPSPFPPSPFPTRGTTTTTSRFAAPSQSSSTVEFTDGEGTVRYDLRCAAPGDPGLAVLVSVLVTPPAVEGEPPPVPEQQLERIRVSLPACVDPALAGTSTEDGTVGDGTSTEDVDATPGGSQG